VTALKLRQEDQARWKKTAGQAWPGGELVFGTRFGTALEPRNFHSGTLERVKRASPPDATGRTDTGQASGQILAKHIPLWVL